MRVSDSAAALLRAGQAHPRASPGGRGLALHLLAVPHFDGPVVGRRGEDGVLVGDSDAVHGSFVFVQVGDQQAFRVPP